MFWAEILWHMCFGNHSLELLQSYYDGLLFKIVSKLQFIQKKVSMFVIGLANLIISRLFFVSALAANLFSGPKKGFGD